MMARNGARTSTSARAELELCAPIFSPMSQLTWYWHRWRAMNPLEMALRARKKIRQIADARPRREWAAVKLECSGAFPKLPRAADAPKVLRDALQRDLDHIVAGRWKVFGHLELKVDDPPKWHCDYLVGKDWRRRRALSD